MKRILMIVLMLGILSVSYSQNIVYDENAEVRQVESFHSIKVNGGITVYLSQSAESGVAVSTDDGKNLNKIRTEVVNGVLNIYPEPGFWNTFNLGNKKVRAYVSLVNLNRLELSGGSIVKTADPIKVETLKMEINGGSILNGNFIGKSLYAEISGGSIVEFKGSFSTASLEANGGSIIKGNAEYQDCVIEANGGSIVDITATKTLSVEANGGSIVKYDGDAVVKNIESNSGSIVKKKK